MDIEQKAKLDKFIKIINKDNETNVMLLGDVPPLTDDQIIKLDIYGLNEAIGVAGLPRGSIIEIYGAEGAGKTTLALHIIAQAQKQGGICCFHDAEHALNLSLANLVGVNVGELVFEQPDNGEQCLELTRQMIESGLFSVLVIDSVPALVPKAQLEKGIGESTSRALLANMMSDGLRVLTPIVKKSMCSVIFINQIREKPGVMFGSPEYQPGGRALKFYASIRMEVRRGEPIKEGKVQVGHNLVLKVIKNKYAPPYKTATIPLNYYTGLDKITGTVESAIAYGVIEQNSSMYYFKDGEWDKSWHGKAAMFAEISTNETLLNDVNNMLVAVIEAWKENKNDSKEGTNSNTENKQ